MKHLALLLAAALPTFALGQVGIGTSTPDNTAALEVSATDKGFLPPRMTAAQRAAILSPAIGLMVYQTDGTAGLYVFNGANWIHQAQWYESSGSPSSTFIGVVPANITSNANQSIGIGQKALQSITSGDDNTSLGYEAAKSTNSGYANTAIGSQTLPLNTIGSGNTAVGFNAGGSNTLGHNNTYLGRLTGSNSNNYSNATALGYGAEATASNSIQLGNLSVTRVTTYGSVGIGTTSPNSAAALEISSTSKALLLPRMTTVQRDAIASPVAGLILYNTTDNKVQFYNGSGWADL